MRTNSFKFYVLYATIFLLALGIDVLLAEFDGLPYRDGIGTIALVISVIMGYGFIFIGLLQVIQAVSQYKKQPTKHQRNFYFTPLFIWMTTALVAFSIEKFYKWYKLPESVQISLSLILFILPIYCYFYHTVQLKIKKK